MTPGPCRQWKQPHTLGHGRPRGEAEKRFLKHLQLRTRPWSLKGSAQVSGLDWRAPGKTCTGGVQTAPGQVTLVSLEREKEARLSLRQVAVNQEEQ